jgi:hypothetical protein
VSKTFNRAQARRAASILNQLAQDLDAQHEDQPTIEFNSARKDLLSDAILKMTVEAKRDLKTR